MDQNNNFDNSEIKEKQQSSNANDNRSGEKAHNKFRGAHQLGIKDEYNQNSTFNLQSSNNQISIKDRSSSISNNPSSDQSRSGLMFNQFNKQIFENNQPQFQKFLDQLSYQNNMNQVSKDYSETNASMFIMQTSKNLNHSQLLMGQQADLKQLLQKFGNMQIDDFRAELEKIRGQVASYNEDLPIYLTNLLQSQKIVSFFELLNRQGLFVPQSKIYYKLSQFQYSIYFPDEQNKDREQLFKLNLRYLKLDNINQIVEMMVNADWHKVAVLNISFSDFNDSHFNNLVDNCSKFKNLRYLDLRMTKIKNIAYKQLEKLKKETKIKYINFSKIRNKDRFSQNYKLKLRELFQNTFKLKREYHQNVVMNQLTKAFLQTFNPESIFSIMKFLQQYQNCPKIQFQSTLNLEHKYNFFYRQIYQNDMSSVKQINLRNNNMNDKDCEYFFDRLHNFKSLTMVDLSKNQIRQIRFQSLKLFNDVIQRNQANEGQERVFAYLRLNQNNLSSQSIGQISKFYEHFWQTTLRIECQQVRHDEKVWNHVYQFRRFIQRELFQPLIKSHYKNALIKNPIFSSILNKQLYCKYDIIITTILENKNEQQKYLQQLTIVKFFGFQQLQRFFTQKSVQHQLSYQRFFKSPIQNIFQKLQNPQMYRDNQQMQIQKVETQKREFQKMEIQNNLFSNNNNNLQNQQARQARIKIKLQQKIQHWKQINKQCIESNDKKTICEFIKKFILQMTKKLPVSFFEQYIEAFRKINDQFQTRLTGSKFNFFQQGQTLLNYLKGLKDNLNNPLLGIFINFGLNLLISNYIEKQLKKIQNQDMQFILKGVKKLMKQLHWWDNPNSSRQFNKQQLKQIIKQALYLWTYNNIGIDYNKCEDLIHKVIDQLIENIMQNRKEIFTQTMQTNIANAISRATNIQLKPKQRLEEIRK